MNKRRLLVVYPQANHWQLMTLDPNQLDHDPGKDYGLLAGESLCQYLLHRDMDSLIIARGPLPFLSGNKTTVGYISPLTGLPHYSFIGGRAAAMLFNLGLDAIWLCSSPSIAELLDVYVVLRGRAPDLTVEFKPASDLPRGQRSAYYGLVEQELDGVAHSGSVFTLGDAAYLGYRSANLAVEAVYHAGRGGAGLIFKKFLSALVLSADPIALPDFFVDQRSAFARNPNDLIAPRLNQYCARLSKKTGGTIRKFLTTGALSGAHPTLPAHNAQQLGYELAELAGERMLNATRDGKMGCHWCRVDCRHWHWVPAEYAPGSRDRFLDDFEPTYALFAMLDLVPTSDSFQGVLDLLERVDRALLLPIEQMGCDVIDVGLALAALFEGIEKSLIPVQDVPPELVDKLAAAQSQPALRLDAAQYAVHLLCLEQAAAFPALPLVGSGPQALVDHYPVLQDIVFTGGPGTLGNAGHANALWTFLMPFSRFFGHYVGQIYKIDESLPPIDADQEAYRACFRRVIKRMLDREFFGILTNVLSQCAFTFIIFSQDGQGERLSDDNLLVRLLSSYGISTTRTDLEWFAQAFWAQSIVFKAECGWTLPSASDFPHRVYEALSLSLGRSPQMLQSLMDLLIEEWKNQAGQVISKFGYDPLW